MIGVVVATHGSLGAALVEAAHDVLGYRRTIETVTVGQKDDLLAAGLRLRAAVERASSAGGVLILTDSFGGTPSNLAVALHQPGHVEVVTGTNLPMVIKALQVADKDVELAVAARQVKEEGQRAIVVTGDVLSAPSPGGER